MAVVTAVMTAEVATMALSRTTSTLAGSVHTLSNGENIANCCQLRPCGSKLTSFLELRQALILHRILDALLNLVGLGLCLRLTRAASDALELTVADHNRAIG